MLKCVLSCLVLITALLSGQSQTVGPSVTSPQMVPNPNAKRYPVSGSVVNALTGAPISRALVQLQGPEPSRAMTGDDGHFEIKDVPEGNYMAAAQRPGYQPGSRSNVQITVGATTAPVECKLLPQSSLHSHILNSDREPVEGVGVQLLRSIVMNGRRDWQTAALSRTDETGEVVFENLSPGRYLVRTEPERVFASSSEIVVDGRHYPELYLPQYFPNAPDRTSAQPIDLQPGSEGEADFTLTAVPAYRVTGTVGQIARYSASCENADGEVVSSAFRLDNRNSKFTLSQLPAGSCTLVVQSGFGRDSTPLYSEVPINITDSDIDGLRISMQPLPDIPITFAGSPNNVDAPAVNLQLVPHHQQRRGVNPPQKVGDTMVFRAVAPGTYSIAAFPNGGNTCIASIVSGNTDLLHNDLVVLPGSAPPPITVTTRTDCGTISGKLPDSAGPASVYIVAVPDGQPAMAKNTFAGNGAFALTGLSPGDYTLYAFTDLQNAAYADPAFLRTVEGQKITIASNDKPTVQINKVNNTGGAQ